MRLTMQVSKLERMISEASNDSDFPLQVQTNSLIDESIDMSSDSSPQKIRKGPIRVRD